MKRGLVILIALATLSLATAAHAETFGAVLTASQETPPNNSTATGEATFTLDPTHTSLGVSISVTGVTGPPTLAHIHKGAFGVAGPVQVDFNGAANFNNGKLNQTFTITKALGDDLVAEPFAYYVNVHTAQFPGGEIRGQLGNLGSRAIIGAELRGANETPPNSSTAFGMATFQFDASNNLIFEIDESGISGNPTGAHIHKGAPGVAGSIVIAFEPPNTFQNGHLRGVISGIDPALAADIQANPGSYYANVHSSAFPGGEIRGQLGVLNEFDLAVAGHATNALGQTFVTDVRIFNSSFTNPAAALLEYFAAGTSANTNASASTVVNIPPRGTALLNDVAGSSGFNISGTGGVRVTSPGNLAITSRIFNDQRAAGKGTFGQFVPAAARSGALRRGVIPQLSNRAIDPNNITGSRTNLGFFNPNTDPAIVLLTMKDSSGNTLFTTTVTVQPFSQQQSSLTSYFPGATANVDDFTVTFDSSVPIDAYASVVDNFTSDQIFVPGQPDLGVQ
jgi:hypothetical protein